MIQYILKYIFINNPGIFNDTKNNQFICSDSFEDTWFWDNIIEIINKVRTRYMFNIIKIDNLNLDVEKETYFSIDTV